MNKKIDSFLKEKTTTFYKAIKLFPQRERDDVSYLYFFLRHIDDIVDEEEKKSLFIKAKKDFFNALKHNKKPLFYFNQLALILLHKYQIPREYFQDFFDTQEKELFKKLKLRNNRDLDNYCYGVAGVVGLMMSRILQLDKSLDKDAITFGNCLQKINILRDIKEDIEKGRFYLPEEILEKFNINKKELIKDKNCYSKMVRHFALENKKKLTKIKFSQINWRIRFSLILAKNTYMRIQEKIEKDPIKYFFKRCRLNFFDWLIIFSKTLIYG